MGYPFALALVGSTYAQAPAAPKGSVVVAPPTYTSTTIEITIDRPVAEVWKRVGKYCDVSEWLQVALCSI
jgi:hypothetical protein